MQESFVFYESYLRGIELQEEGAQLRLLLAVCRYALRDEEPEGLQGSELGMFEMMRPTVDSNKHRREAGSKGGAPKGNKNASKGCSKKEKQPKQPSVDFSGGKKQPNGNENGNGNGNENGTEDGNETEKSKPPPLQDFSKVELTQEQTGELVRLSDSLSVKEYVNKLAVWQAENKKLCKKPYAVIKKWLEQDGGKPPFKPGFTGKDKEQSYKVEQVQSMIDNFARQAGHY